MSASTEAVIRKPKPLCLRDRTIGCKMVLDANLAPSGPIALGKQNMVDIASRIKDLDI